MDRHVRATTTTAWSPRPGTSTLTVIPTTASSTCRSAAAARRVVDVRRRRASSRPGTARPRSSARATGVTTRGRITAKTETRGTTRGLRVYSYDGTDRLTGCPRRAPSCARPTTTTPTATVDGQRAGDAATSPTTTQDRLTNVGAATYTYTAAGELRKGRAAHHLRLRRAAARCAGPSGRRSKLDYVIDAPAAASASSATAWSRRFLYGVGRARSRSSTPTARCAAASSTSTRLQRPVG